MQKMQNHAKIEPAEMRARHIAMAKLLQDKAIEYLWTPSPTCVVEMQKRHTNSR